jgi:AcrR family transcriptional regulator
MRETRATGRANQRLRTRKELLVAAARLLDEGRTPTMDEVAEAALVSRATAYRYFPTLESLLAEAPLQGEAPDPERLFATDVSTDPEARIEAANAAMHRMAWRNAPQLRLMLASILAAHAKADSRAPKRQNRRTPLIEAALEPVRDRLDPVDFRRLCRALALIVGTESMIVCADILNLNERSARDVTQWAARALVRQALAEAAGG